MLKAILFDLDGVVIDSEPLYVEAEERFFEQNGIDIPPDDWQLFKGLSEQAFFDLIEQRYQPNWDRATAMKEASVILREVFREGLDFMPGFIPLADRLRERYRLGLVTSTSRALLDVVSGLLPPLTTIFPQIICGDDVTRSKPHPEPYLMMMQLLDVLPEETAVVEDSINGLGSAKASGAYTIALTGSAPIEALRTADRVIHALKEMTEAFLDSLAFRLNPRVDG
jgi:HAD superfamily hydrolase (TIGR01509 family)